MKMIMIIIIVIITGIVTDRINLPAQVHREVA